METGLIGLVILCLGVILLLVQTMRLLYRRDDFFAVGLGGAMLWVLFSLAIHSFFDFALRNNANALLFLMLVVVGTLALRSGRDGAIRMPPVKGGWFLVPGKSGMFSFQTRSPVIRATISGAAVLTLILLIGQVRDQLAVQFLCPDKKNLAFQLNQNPEPKSISQAIARVPARPYPYAKLAHLQQGQESNLENMQLISSFYVQALRHRPFEARYWYALGVSCYNQAMSSRKQAERDRLHDCADQCMDMVLKFRGTDPRMINQVVDYLRRRMEQGGQGRGGE